MPASMKKLAILTFALAATSVYSIDELHPSFTVKHLLGTEMNAVGGLGGIDLLPNGDGVVCTWGGSQQPTGKTSMSNGEVWIIPNLASGTPGTATRVATGLREPLGVRVVGSDFYVMEKPRISKFVGSGTTWTKSTLWSLPTAWYNDNQWHHFSFNLLYKEGAFWFATGMAYDYDPNDPVQRGGLIRVPLAGGSYTQLARGLRETNGIGLGPDSEIFCTDNQGHWKPVDYLYHIPTKNVPTNGRFYGFRTNGNNSCGITPPTVAGSSLVPGATGKDCPNDPEYPPAIWIPYPSLSNNPTRPILLKAGPYAGQMISGDVYHGNTLRYFVEKVKGEYQGAVFGFMNDGPGGINFGINQFQYTPSGSLLAIGIGGGTCSLGGSGNWNWNGTCRGLDLLTPTTVVPFDILAIRSIANGFEIEFTQPAKASAGTAANYRVQTTVFTPQQCYGCDGGTTDNNINVAVSSASLSTDGRKATIQLASVQTMRMYAITISNVQSATNEALYTNVGYYTLNYVGPADPPVAVNPRVEFTKNLRFSTQVGKVSLALPFNQPYQVGLFGLDGRKIVEQTGSSPATLSSGALPAGIYWLLGHVGGSDLREKIRVE